MSLKKKTAFLIHIAYAAVILAIAVLVCRRFLTVLLPFLIAWLVSIIVRPVVQFLISKCRFRKGIAAAVVVVLFYALIGFLAAIVGIRLLAFVKQVVTGFPNYYNENVEPFLIMVTDRILQFASNLSPEASNTVREFLLGFSSSFESVLTNASVTALKWLTSFAIRMPTAMLKILITIIATVFISSDYPYLKKYVMAQFPNRTQRLLREVRTHLYKTIGKYIRSYFLIMLITFGELFAGLSVIGQKSAAMIAALIAVLDIFPVVGSGTVLIPWTLISIVKQDYAMALKIGILYLAITVIRNIIEPKIVGQHVGMHPIVTLMAMVIGTYVFGPIGLLGLPITIALCVSLNDEGIIHVFKTPDPDEPAEKTAEEDPGDGDALEPCEAESIPEETEKKTEPEDRE